MENQNENLPLLMVRSHLQDIPAAEMPPGFTLRPLRGFEDAEAWLTLIRAAEQFGPVKDDTFTRSYGTNDQEIAERIYFLADENGQPVATVAAWYGEGERAGWGRIHWLYILPEYQSKGFGKALLTFALRRLTELGHEQVYLTTSTGRTAAVRLYRAYGFMEE